jgi:hypothetical protein
MPITNGCKGYRFPEIATQAARASQSTNHPTIPDAVLPFIDGQAGAINIYKGPDDQRPTAFI